ncbi:MAG TPA: AmmeMemoRadiSam system radical SAM enzyme [Bacteroidales bacterium]|nr:AmmeMemoRadiSam system radical SAM enzyme [Bacteroidales bacterium]
MNKISKRQFLRTSLAGIGALAAGSVSLKSFSKTITAMGTTPLHPTGGFGRFSRESPYSVTTPKGVKCQICPNNCILKEGLDSICRTHAVRDGKLYTIAYGNPCSVHTDPIEKKPLFHYLPASSSFSIATAGCNFACLNCQNWEISQQSPRDTNNIDLFPERVVEEAVKAGCHSIAYTYSEPIAFFEYMIDTARLARAKGIKNLLISNGYINERPLLDLCKYIDAANINLKSFSEETYAKLNGGSLQPVLNTLKTLKSQGVWLEITNLVVPGWTDDLGMIREMCTWLSANGFSDNPLHFSRFHPLYKLTSLPYTPTEVLDKARTIALQSGIRYVYIGNVPGTQAESTYCHHCRKPVIERRGFSILANNLVRGTCRFCGTPVPGVWE